MIFEKPSVLGESTIPRQELRPSSLRGSRKVSNETPEEKEGQIGGGRTRVSTMQGQNKQWAKLGDMLRTEHGKRSLLNDGKLGSLQQKSMYMRDTGNITFEESKVNQSAEKKARKDKGAKEEQEGQASIKSIFSNVKSFFS